MSVVREASFREILAVLADIPKLAKTWDRQSEDSQVDVYLEWDELMRRLESLTRAYEQGRMTPDQDSRYRLLVEKLEEARPLLARLDLQHPRLTPEPSTHVPANDEGQ